MRCRSPSISATASSVDVRSSLPAEQRRRVRTDANAATRASSSWWEERATTASSAVSHSTQRIRDSQHSALSVAAAHTAGPAPESRSNWSANKRTHPDHAGYAIQCFCLQHARRRYVAKHARWSKRAGSQSRARNYTTSGTAQRGPVVNVEQTSRQNTETSDGLTALKIALIAATTESAKQQGGRARVAMHTNPLTHSKSSSVITGAATCAESEHREACEGVITTTHQSLTTSCHSQLVARTPMTT